VVQILSCKYASSIFFECRAQSGQETQKKKGDVPEQPKGIYTSPAKKGSFGMNKTTLSERVGYKGVATE
jgi:hypothetical protein